jgi:hypothetical protein
MQNTIYSAEDEQELMARLWSPAIKDNPLAFVMFAFPWGVKGTPLENFSGPRKWQREVLLDIAEHIKTQPRQAGLRRTARGHIVWPWYWQVGVGQLVGDLDDVHADRLDDHRVGQQ